jgi:hypothetical protein
MSSFFSKLRALLTARARGPRRYEAPGAPPTETESQRSSLPEVTEAPARARKQPEVTDAPAIETSPAERAAPVSQPSLGAQGVAQKEERSESLEEKRIVDLLRGEQS